MFLQRFIRGRDKYRVQDILDNGQLKPQSYFQSLGLGFKTDELLKINDICNAIPQKWKDSAIAGTFQQVDPTNFDFTLNISGQKINLQFLNSRKLYEVMVENLQLSYVLHIKDDHNSYDYTDKEMKDLFINREAPH